MAEEVQEITLPSPFSLLGRTEKPTVFLQLLATVGSVVGGGICVALIHRHRRVKRKRYLHEKRIELWLENKEAERQDRLAFLEQSGDDHADHEGKDSIRFNLDEGLELWVEANRLGCTNALPLYELVLTQLKRELKNCVGHVKENWRYERPLAKLVGHVKKLKAEKQLGEIYAEAAKTSTILRTRNRKQLFTIMILSSKYRVMGLGLTTLIAYVSDQLESAVSETYTQWMECFVNSDPHTTILKWATINLMLCLSTAVISFGVEKVSSLLLAGFKKETDTKLYQALANMDMEFFDTHTDKEINEIADLTTELLEADAKLHSLVKNIIRIYSKVSHLLRTNVRMTASLFGLCGLYTSIDYTINWYTSVSKEDEDLDLSSLETPLLEEANTASSGEDSANSAAATAVANAPPIPEMDLFTVMQNIKSLRVFGLERNIMQHLLANSKDSDQEPAHSNVMSALVDCTGTWALSGVRLWGIWHAAWLVQLKVLDYPLAQLNTLVTQAFMAFQEMRNLDFNWVDEFGADAALLSQIIESVPKIEKDEGIIPTDFKGEVEFRGVHFAYPSTPNIPILRGLSFKATAGQFVGLVGPSGCGKSAVLQLIQRLYDPIRGEILIDGIDMKEYNPRWLRTQMAVVSQNVQLFDMSIEDNIRLTNPSATREEIIEAARRASAYDFIMRLPNGFSTNLSKCQMSGGQRQRISIARALATNAKILILDEATSALDNVAEREVQATLNEVMKGKTTFSVTHRLVTVHDADQIVVIKKGICVESGTHDKLIGLKGLYSKLAASHDPAPIGVTKSIASTTSEVATQGDEDASFQRGNTPSDNNPQLAAFSREFHGISRKLQMLNIHNDTLQYKREVRVSIEQIISQMQDAIGRMGRDVKDSASAPSKFEQHRSVTRFQDLIALKLRRQAPKKITKEAVLDTFSEKLTAIRRRKSEVTERSARLAALKERIENEKAATKMEAAP